MTLQDLCTNLETSLALQKAGVFHWSYAVYCEGMHGPIPYPRCTLIVSKEICPAYTAQELAHWLYEKKGHPAATKAVEEYFWPYVPAEYTNPEIWANCILSLFEKGIITLPQTNEAK